MATTLKIMSWNVEKFSVTTNSISSYNTVTLLKTIDYIGQVIKDLDPDIVCFIETDPANSISLISSLISYLGANWKTSVSPAIIGGNKTGLGLNEQYLVFYNTNNIEIKGAQLLDDKQASGLMRMPFSFIFKIKSNNVFCEIWINHLNSNKNQLGKLGSLVDNYLKTFDSTSPIKYFFLAGDFNANADRLNEKFKGSNSQINDIYNSFNIAVGQKDEKEYIKSSELQFPDQTKGPLKSPQSNSLLYRAKQKGLDDIISLTNLTVSPNKSPQPGYDEETGVVDTILGYSEPSTLQNHIYLKNLPNGNLLREEKIIPTPVSGAKFHEVDYTKYLKSNPSKQTDIDACNAWIRYLGGISDHLPVVMTINIS